jgi:hypothetical protein
MCEYRGMTGVLNRGPDTLHDSGAKAGQGRNITVYCRIVFNNERMNINDPDVT